MTEGAERGTLRCDAEKFDCQPGNPMVPGGSWVVPLSVAEQLERINTEALKIAGDSLDALEKAELWIRENGHRGVAAPFRSVIIGNRAALERIRNNKH